MNANRHGKMPIVLCCLLFGLLTRCQRTGPLQPVERVEHTFSVKVDPAAVDGVKLEGDLPNLPRTLSPQGKGTFSTVVGGLVKGARYRYRFLVYRKDLQRWVAVSDPKAWQLDASVARWSVLVAGEIKPPRPRALAPKPFGNLAIYELNPRELFGQSPFAALHPRPPAGSFGRVFRRITALIESGYFSRLGVNTLELMPVLAQGWRQQKGGPPLRTPWGYQAISWYAINGDFGTARDLAKLVDTAHEHGLAVLADVSFEHGYGGKLHGLITDLFPAWRKPKPKNPWGLLELDISNHHTFAFCLGALERLLLDFNIDGLRLDWTDKVPAEVWKKVIQHVRSYKPKAILISENPKSSFVAQSGFDGVWDFFFHWEAPLLLREIYKNFDGFSGRMVDTQAKLVENLRAKAFPPNGAMRLAGIDTNLPPPVVRYIESHDLPRIARTRVRWQHGGENLLDVNGDGRTPDWLENGSHAKSRLGATLLTTLPGAIMLFAGQEFGADDPLVWAFDPLVWQKSVESKATFAHYSKLLKLRATHPAARSNDLRIMLNDTQRHLLVYARGTDARQTRDDRLVVGLNFSKRAHPMRFELPSAGIWYDRIGGRTYRGSSVALTLGESASFLLEKQEP